MNRENLGIFMFGFGAGVLVTKVVSKYFLKKTSVMSWLFSNKFKGETINDCD